MPAGLLPAVHNALWVLDLQARSRVACFASWLMRGRRYGGIYNGPLFYQYAMPAELRVDLPQYYFPCPLLTQDFSEAAHYTMVSYIVF